jgi:hypothetical protein
MKNAMAVKLLLAGVCALGAAAAAQTDTSPNSGSQQQQGGIENTPSQQSGNTEAAPAESPSGYGSDSSATTPRKNMTMSEKKQSLENIKRAIRDSESSQGRLSGEQGTSAETGSMSSQSEGVQHLKVIRRGDKVVLRGTVRTQEEKDRIGSVAEGAASGEQIVNELKVK